MFQYLIRHATAKSLDRMKKEENYLFLKSNPMLGNLSAEGTLFLLRNLFERRYSMGDLVFKQGNPGVCLFLVRQGRVEIYYRDPQFEDNLVYGVVERGAMFGELSVVSTYYRNATAKALDNDTVLLALSGFDLQKFGEQFPQDGLKMLKAVTDTTIHNLLEVSRKCQEAYGKIERLEKKVEKLEERLGHS